jgi:hypothetical protein
MFKKVLQSLTKSLGRPNDPKKPAPAKPAPETAKAEAKAEAEATKPAPKAESKGESALKKIVTPAKTPEELCGIESKMSKDQIKERLKLLYRRFNRAASSLDAKTRAEADEMLDAIVRVREKTFGEI